MAPYRLWFVFLYDWDDLVMLQYTHTLITIDQWYARQYWTGEYYGNRDDITPGVILVTRMLLYSRARPSNTDCRFFFICVKLIKSSSNLNWLTFLSFFLPLTAKKTNYNVKYNKRIVIYFMYTNNLTELIHWVKDRSSYLAAYAII